jgi:hypothetical protein
MDYPKVIALLNELDKTFNQIQRIHTLQSDSYKKFVDLIRNGIFYGEEYAKELRH